MEYSILHMQGVAIRPIPLISISPAVSTYFMSISSSLANKFMTAINLKGHSVILVCLTSDWHSRGSPHEILYMV